MQPQRQDGLPVPVLAAARLVLRHPLRAGRGPLRHQPTHLRRVQPELPQVGISHHDGSSASNSSLYLEPTLTPCAAAGGPGGWPLPTLRVHPATANIQTPSNTASITWELEENIVKLALCFFQYVAIMSVLNLCNCERDTYLPV